MRVTKHLDQKSHQYKRSSFNKKSFDQEKYDEKEEEAPRSIDFENVSMCSCSCYQLPSPETDLRQRLAKISFCA